jgi:beta-hydroxylase
LQDLSPDQSFLTTDDSWKTFMFLYYGHPVEDNCARCPRTVELLRSIPGIRTAMFSILAPGKHIPRHTGLYNGLLRCHLGLIVPPGDACRINVGDETRTWEEGKCLVLDDSRPHEVWNDSARERVVLLFDFDRPLTGLLAYLNRMMLWRLASRPFVLAAVERARERRLSEGGLGNLV